MISPYYGLKQISNGMDNATAFIKCLFGAVTAAYRDLDGRISIVTAISRDTVNSIDNKK